MDLQYHVHPGGCVLYIDETGCLPFECVGDGCKLLRIQLPELFDMRLIVACLHEKRKRQLLQLRACLRIVLSYRREEEVHLVRENHVAYLYSCKKRTRKRAEIDDVAAAFKPFQRRHGPAEVSQLTVVIVFDYVAVVFRRPVEQFVPPADRHHGSGEDVVRRADIRGSPDIRR